MLMDKASEISETKMAIWKNPFASKRSKVRPLWFDTNSSNETVRLTADRFCNPRGIEYLQARRAFLSSYQFSEHKSFKEKLKRSVKGIEETALEAFLQIREKISRKRVQIRVYRFNLTWPTGVFVRCFVPWPYKHHKFIDA